MRFLRAQISRDESHQSTPRFKYLLLRTYNATSNLEAGQNAKTGWDLSESFSLFTLSIRLAHSVKQLVELAEEFNALGVTREVDTGDKR